MTEKKKPYEIVSEEIQAKMSAGVIPWHKPFAFQLPYNGVTGYKYRGVNVWLCLIAGFASPRWFTFKKISERGGDIKGEKGSLVVWWQMRSIPEPPDKDPDAVKTFPILKYYKVWNDEQIIGMDFEPLAVRDTEPIAECENILDAYTAKPPVRINGVSAHYDKMQDFVGTPPQTSFDTDAEYYNTLFHEMAHSTGHPNRLDRFSLSDPSDFFGSESYSEEELTAELTAAYLAGVAGIGRPTIDNSAAYCQSWMRAFQDDDRMFIFAAQRAQKAADYIQGQSYS